MSSSVVRSPLQIKISKLAIRVACHVNSKFNVLRQKLKKQLLYAIHANSNIPPLNLVVGIGLWQVLLQEGQVGVGRLGSFFGSVG